MSNTRLELKIRDFSSRRVFLCQVDALTTAHRQRRHGDAHTAAASAARSGLCVGDVRFRGGRHAQQLR